MRFSLEKKDPKGIEFGIIYGVIALILILGVAWWSPVLSLAPDCFFRGLTGFPCPSCGSTRALAHLSQGDVFSAFSMNPLFTLVMLGAVLSFFFSLITLAFDLRRIKCRLTEKEQNIARAAAALVLLAQWAYLIRRP